MNAEDATVLADYALNTRIITAAASLAGLILGGLLGRWWGGHSAAATIGGAIGGGLVVGSGTFFITSQAYAVKFADRLLTNQAAAAALPTQQSGG